MREHTNARPTDAVILSFSVPADRVAEAMRAMKGLGFEPARDATPWRDVLGYTNEEMPGVLLSGARYREGLTQAQLAARRPDFAAARSEVGHVHASLVKAALTQIALRRERLLALDARLQALDMAQVLARGYSVATTVDGRVVREADELSADQKLELHFSRGTAGVRVESVQTAQKLQQTQKNQRD